MPKPRRIFLDTEYGQMHVRISRPDNASKPPLICLHMSPQSGAAFTSFMTCASTDRIIIAPDYHGFGESDRPPENPHVRVQDYARTIWQALESLDLKVVDLLGHHTGSKVAAEMAFQHPERVGKIIMISASVMDIDEFKLLKETSIFEPITIDEKGTRITSLWKSMRGFFNPKLPSEIVFKFLLDALRAGDGYQWGNRAAFLYNESFPEVLKSLNHQITVINPKDDLYAVTPNILPLLKNGRFTDKPEWEHGLFDVNTRDVCNSIKEILNETEEDHLAEKIAS